MKKIIDRVRDKKKELEHSDAAGKNQRKAFAAILGGIRSPAWRAYMEQFLADDDPGDDPEKIQKLQELRARQLARLLATDGTHNNEFLNEKRAYLAANGGCGQGTRGLFDNQVEGIDNDL